MTGGQSGFLILFVVALLLIMIAVQGTLGQFLAILFCPTYITITDED
jgi:hypothetical protein